MNNTPTAISPSTVYLSPTEAGKFLGKDGRPLHRTSVVRAIEHGIKVRGMVVRLQAQRMTWGWGVTRAAIDRFLDSLNVAYGNTPRGVVTPTWRETKRGPRTPRVSKDQVGTYEADRPQDAKKRRSTTPDSRLPTPDSDKPSGRTRQRAGHADPAGRV